MSAPITSFKKFLKKQAPVTIIPLAHKNVKPMPSIKGENSGNVDMSNGGLTDAMTEGPDKTDHTMQESVELIEVSDPGKAKTEHLKAFLARYDSDEPGMSPAFGAKIRSVRKELLRRGEKLEKPKVFKEEHHYYVSHNVSPSDSNHGKLFHKKDKPFATAREAEDHIMKLAPGHPNRRALGRIHKVDTKTGNIVQVYNHDTHSRGYAYSPGDGDVRHIRDLREDAEQLDELAKTPMKTGKTEDLHSRLSKYYNIDAKDKEAVGVYQKYHNHINNAYGKFAKGPDQKSKPDPVDAESQKTQTDALAAGKKIDTLLSAHKAPEADFHVYAGLKHHPFENIKDEQGYDPGDEPVEAHIPGFAQTSIDPGYAKQNAGKGGHVLKMQIKAGSKHGAYIGHVNNGGHDKEFLVRPGRKLRIDPKPEMHGDTHIWHGEIQG